MIRSPSDERALGGLLIALLGALTALAPLSIDMYLPALPSLEDDFEASSSLVQLTLTACLGGLAVGQVLAGPLSDRLGRRRPMLVGLFVYTGASVLCAVAPNAGAMVAFRLLQGFAGAAAIVIARAVVRDVSSGVAAARIFSLLVLANGVAPVLAPVFGAQLLKVTSWRGVFVTLAAIGGLLAVLVGVWLRETLPPERRHAGELAETGNALRSLATDRAFVGYALSSGLAFGAMFAYIAGSPLVLQDIFGLSPQLFSAVFAVNAGGLIVASQVNRHLLRRFDPWTLLAAGVTPIAVGGVALLAVVLVGGLGVWAVLVPLFVVVASIGIVVPNATALALADHPDAAGSASGLLGVIQFVIGAAAAPLVGVAGSGTAVPMALVMAVLGVGSVAAFVFLTRSATSTEGSPACAHAEP